MKTRAVDKAYQAQAQLASSPQLVNEQPVGLLKESVAEVDICMRPCSGLNRMEGTLHRCQAPASHTCTSDVIQPSNRHSQLDEATFCIVPDHTVLMG